MCREIIIVSSEIHTKHINALFEQNVDFFSSVRKISESDYYPRHVCLSAWKNSIPTGRIFMKFDI